MAHVARQQNFVLHGAGQIAFAVGERSVLQGGIDAHFVCFILAQCRQLRVAQTKPPGRSVVGGAIRNPVREIGQTEEVRTELVQRHGGVYWYAVVDHVQVGLTEIDEALTASVFDEGIADMPFLRYGPVQHRRAARHLMEGERNPLGNSLQRRAHTAARNATAERKQLSDEAVHGLTAFRRQGHQVVRSTRHHRRHPVQAIKSGYCWSRSAMTVTGSGQRMPKAGSFHRTPRAHAGV